MTPSSLPRRREWSTIGSVRPAPSVGTSLPEGFRPDLEGLRGIGILLVVAYHVGVPGFSGGYVGVDVFFVLSGYLITGLLTAEHAKSGRINLVEFYARRVRRLVPAALMLLTAVLLIGAATLAPWELNTLGRSATAAGMYLSNIRFARHATDYLGDTARDFFLHTWSLSVEEQFYLAWPAIIWFGLAATRGRNHMLMRILALTGVTSLAGSLLLTKAHQPWAFFLMPPRWWEFCLGGAIRLATEDRKAANRVWTSWATPAGLFALIVAAFVFDERTSFPGSAALLPAMGTAGILAGAPRRSRLLATPLLRKLGSVSYSLYLWHWPVLVFASSLSTRLSPGWKAGCVALALLLAGASTRFVEVPIRRSRLLSARPVMVLATAAAGVIVVVSSASLLRRWSGHLEREAPFNRLAAARKDLPTPYADGCILPIHATRPRSGCVYGNRGSPQSVVLFGDSHAAQWFPAVAATAAAHNWRVIVMIKSSCPPAAISVYNTALRRGFTECDRWRDAAIRAIHTIKPSLVLMSGYSGYEGGSGVDGRKVIPEHRWKDGYRQTLYRLRGAEKVVVIVDTPQLPFDPTTCLARQTRLGGLVGSCLLRAKAAHRAPDNRSTQAPGKPEEIPTIDLTSEICEDVCPLERRGLVLYRDSHHLTASFARSLGPAFRESLERSIASTNEDGRVPASSRVAYPSPLLSNP